MTNAGLTATAILLDKRANRNEPTAHPSSTAATGLNRKKIQLNPPEKQLPHSPDSTVPDTKNLRSRIFDVNAYQSGSVLYTVGCGFFTADALKPLPRSPRNIAGCAFFSLGSACPKTLKHLKTIACSPI